MRGEKEVRKELERVIEHLLQQASGKEIWGRRMNRQAEETRKRSKEDQTKQCMKIMRRNLLFHMLI